MDSANREVEFLMDRIFHQEFLRENEYVICDRYIWSGLAYCKVFNPSVYDFATTIYQHRYFRKPDLYVFVDTPPDICCQRRHVPAQLSNLINLRQAYMDTKPFITGSDILTVDGTKDLDTLTNEVMKRIRELNERN
jgi:thymidylate kinase